jgi:hypothetical protein
MADIPENRQQVGHTIVCFVLLLAYSIWQMLTAVSSFLCNAKSSSRTLRQFSNKLAQMYIRTGKKYIKQGIIRIFLGNI